MYGKKFRQMEQYRFLCFWDNKPCIFIRFKCGSNVISEKSRKVEYNRRYFFSSFFFFFEEFPLGRTVPFVVSPEQPVFPCKRKALPRYSFFSEEFPLGRTVPFVVPAERPVLTCKRKVLEVPSSPSRSFSPLPRLLVTQSPLQIVLTNLVDTQAHTCCLHPGR